MRKGRNAAALHDAINESHDQVYELSESMREAFESTPEVFQATTGKPRQDAADDLEAACMLLNGDDVPKELRHAEVAWLEMRAGKDGKLSRPTRRNNVFRCLQVCVARLATVPRNDDAVKLITEWRHAIEILEGVHFPGMTGRRAA